MTDFNSTLTSIAESLFMNMWWWKYFMQKYSGIEFDYLFGGSGLMIIKNKVVSPVKNTEFIIFDSKS